MKLLLFSDNHFSMGSSILRARGSSYSLRLENQIKSLDWVESIAVQRECDAIVCLGDFFDSPTLNAEEISALGEIQWSSIPKIFIVGNHELGLVVDSYNSANIFSLISNCRVIGKPTIIQDEVGTQLCFLPYTKDANSKNLDSIFGEEFLMGAKRIILSHNDIRGINYGGHLSKNGLSIEDIEQHCDLFINGHLHNCGTLNNMGTIINIGNLTGQNFLEDATTYPHRAIVLETSTLQMECFENPYALNFYNLDVKKCDFKSMNNIKDSLKSNAVLSIKCEEPQLEMVREVFNCEKVLSSRVVVEHTISNMKEENIIVPTTTHIDQFVSYIHSTIGQSDLIDEEIENIIK